MERTRVENNLAGGNKNKPAPPPEKYVHQRYPMAMHRKDGLMRIVKNEAEELALGDAFSDTPPSVEEAAMFAQPGGTPSPSPAGTRPGTCAMCVKLTTEKAELEARFSKSWSNKHDELIAKCEELDLISAQNEALSKDAELSFTDAQAKEKEHAAVLAQNEALMKQVETLTEKLKRKAA